MDTREKRARVGSQDVRTVRTDRTKSIYLFELWLQIWAPHIRRAQGSGAEGSADNVRWDPACASPNRYGKCLV